MTTKKRRGDVADPEIVKLVRRVSRIVGGVMDLDSEALMHRPRPNNDLRAGRYIIVDIMHHKYGVSQQRIAAALKAVRASVSKKGGKGTCDRGVISDAAHAMDEASSMDVDIALGLKAVHEACLAGVEAGEAWDEALSLERIEDAQRQAREVEDAEAPEIEEEAPVTLTFRCHGCIGKGKVKIHMLGRDPVYQAQWKSAEAIKKSADGFHQLICKVCNGSGRTKPPTRRTAVAGGAL